MTKLTCKSCGGKLELTDDIDQFSCGYCGTEWLVNRRGGIVSLKPIEEKLQKIEEHTKATSKHTEKIMEHSQETSVSSSILANEIKLKRLQEKILSLEGEKEKLEKEIKKAKPNGVSYFVTLIVSMFVCSYISGGIKNIIKDISPETESAITCLTFIVILALAVICMSKSGKCPQKKQEILYINDQIKQLKQKFEDINKQQDNNI
jgi:DNA-directed RNA polymerase subunit RPC12/RpoP/cell division protein FtsL